MVMKSMRINQTAIAKWVLAAFVLTVLVSVVSTFTNRSAYAVTCSAFSVSKALTLGDTDAPTKANRHTLDCPLCVSFFAPPPTPPKAEIPRLPTAEGVMPRLFLWVSLPVLAPLPARGPPQA